MQLPFVEVVVVCESHAKAFFGAIFDGVGKGFREVGRTVVSAHLGTGELGRMDSHLLGPVAAGHWRSKT